MFRQCCSALGWTTALYLAVVAPAVLDERTHGGIVPVFAAAVAAWAVAVMPPARAVIWAALAGFAIDAASHDRLGLHLATFAVSAALLAPLPRASFGRGWSAAVFAFAIAFGDELASKLLGTALGVDHCSAVQIGIVALETGAITGVVVLAIVSVIWLMHRVVHAHRSARPMEVANRWTMLTE